MGVKRVLTASLCALGFAGVQAQLTDTPTVHSDPNQSVLLHEDRVTLDQRLDPSGPRITSIEQAVKKYLLSKGIPDTLFKVLYSYGKRKPLNDNGDEEKRSLNRRVTITWRLAEQPAAGPSLRDALRDTAGVIGKTICCMPGNMDGFDIETQKKRFVGATGGICVRLPRTPGDRHKQDEL
jgi:hypothetical protein